eukprot:1195110-Prorocentrum_minimum.AAC.2
MPDFYRGNDCGTAGANPMSDGAEKFMAWWSTAGSSKVRDSPRLVRESVVRDNKTRPNCTSLHGTNVVISKRMGGGAAPGGQGGRGQHRHALPEGKRSHQNGSYRILRRSILGACNAVPFDPFQAPDSAFQAFA